MILFYYSIKHLYCQANNLAIAKIMGIQRKRRREIARNDVVPRSHELKKSQKYGIILVRLSDAQIGIAH